MERKQYRDRAIKRPGLFLESASDYSIRNEYGKLVAVEDARTLWESGVIEDWNMAFYRLATRCNFDLDEVKRQYAALPRPAGVHQPGEPEPDIERDRR